jgi:glutathione-regulated potassium-efflux system ancillary protein KefC
MALESLGLGAYEARERADLFRRLIPRWSKRWRRWRQHGTERAAVFKRTSAMLTEIINEDRNHLSLIQRHGWQGTEEGKHTGNPETNRRVNLPCEVELPAILKNFFSLPCRQSTKD